ncbi:hypothetical protein GCM10009850_087610 [Nonomuraea monospora]|uniref:Uncharacterized protein n=1 Tax=Nonomuraea monospora TaxID=568818 RepID=A0ABP5PNY7_9ACTN
MTLDSTGTDDITVNASHARGLNAHGPGWALMWNDRHHEPLIVRHRRGDDGSLLEICAYEHMFKLSGEHDACDDCTTCGLNDTPDYNAIAAAMTEILRDYYPERHTIATHMPATLPYTRALSHHGIRRLFQGTLRETTFDQLYRAPGGHLIEIMFPSPPPPH